LHSAKELAEAERSLREQLPSGAVDEDTAYLTRWDEEAKQVEVVVGSFDHAARMEAFVSGLGLASLACEPGKPARFAILPFKAAVVAEPRAVIVPVVQYLNADPTDGRYRKGPDGLVPPIEWKLKHLALSRPETSRMC
jgi:hypothetical protein